nr:hypothetical protein [Gemmatimonadaceae bacterium]
MAVCLTKAVVLASAVGACTLPAVATAQRALLTNPAAPHWSTPAPDTVLLDVTTSKGLITIELILKGLVR